PFSHGGVQPLPAVLALHSDGSQSLISSQKEAARQAAEPPKPSRTAVVKAIPAPLAHTRFQLPTLPPSSPPSTPNPPGGRRPALTPTPCDTNSQLLEPVSKHANKGRAL